MTGNGRSGDREAGTGDAGTGETGRGLEELGELLDIWGGNAERWPAHVRPRIVELLGLPGSQALIEDARALDRLISSAGDAPAPLSIREIEVRSERIMAAAVASSPLADSPPLVVPFQSRQRPDRDRLTDRGRLADTVPVARVGRGSFERQWQAAGLMAASLLVGVYVGGNINVGPLVQELADAAGISSVVDPGLTEDIGEDETP